MIFNWLATLLCVFVLTIMGVSFNHTGNSTMLWIMGFIFVCNIPNFIIVAKDTVNDGTS